MALGEGRLDEPSVGCTVGWGWQHGVGEYQLIPGDWSGDYCCSQLGRKDGLQAEEKVYKPAVKSFSVQWPYGTHGGEESRTAEQQDMRSPRSQEERAFQWLMEGWMQLRGQVDWKSSPGWGNTGAIAGLAEVTRCWGEAMQTEWSSKGAEQKENTDCTAIRQGRYSITRDGHGCEHFFGWGYYIFGFRKEIEYFLRMIDSCWEGEVEYCIQEKKGKYNQ